MGSAHTNANEKKGKKRGGRSLEGETPLSQPGTSDVPIGNEEQSGKQNKEEKERVEYTDN